MKRFLANVLLLAFLASVLAAALALFAYSEPAPPKRFGPEVFRAIKVCTAPSPGARVLVLGDSVANQVFATRPPPPPEVAVATCNQAVGAIGNRLLLDRWLALHPGTAEVVYAMVPGSLRNDGVRAHTFHYLIHPFAETGLLDGATEEVRAHLARRFGRVVVENASLRHLLYRNDRLYDFYERHLVRMPGDVRDGMPETVAVQLEAMQAACAARGVRFRLAFLPTAPAAAPSAAFRAQCADRLRGVLPGIDGAFAAFRTEPAESFSDGVHFTPERLAEIREPLRAAVLGGNGTGAD